MITPLEAVLLGSTTGTLVGRVLLTWYRERPGRPHHLGDPDRIRELEEELRPWEPWPFVTEPPRPQPLLINPFPGPETRAWLLNDTCTDCDNQHHARREGT